MNVFIIMIFIPHSRSKNHKHCHTVHGIKAAARVRASTPRVIGSTSKITQNKNSLRSMTLKSHPGVRAPLEGWPILSYGNIKLVLPWIVYNKYTKLLLVACERHRDDVNYIILSLVPRLP